MSTEQEGVELGSDAVNGSRVEAGIDEKDETLVDPLSGQAQEKEDKQEESVTVEPVNESLGFDHGVEKSNRFTDLEKETESVNGELDLGSVETKESEKIEVPVGKEGLLVVVEKEGTKVENLDVEGKKTEESVHSKEVLVVKSGKDSDGIEAEKEVEPEMVSSHDVTLDSEGTKVENLDNEGKENETKEVPVDSEEVLVVKCGKDSDGIEAVVGKEVESKLVSSNGSGKHGTKVDNLDVESFVCIEPHESKDESASDDDDDNAPVTLKVKLSDSDMVWAKVRSHPWWPGQVFDVSAASDKAKKHSKKGSVLVTYFGDCTYAWNDASKIKPFQQNFPQMAKQSRLPDFVDAVDFALEEVSRRIEFGLACSCISEEVYEKIKTQNIINPGIREESSSIHGGDKVSSGVFFEPANLVDYVKRLALSPSYGASDELLFVSQRAKLLAFNRWKGYTDLPEFVTLQGSVESAPKISPAEEKNSLPKVKVAEPKKTAKVYTKRKKTEDQDDCEVFEYDDTTVPKKKKEKTFEDEETIVPKKRKEKKEKTFEDEETIVPKKRKEKKEKTSEDEETIVPKKRKGKKEKTFEDEETVAPKKKKEKKEKTSKDEDATILKKKKVKEEKKEKTLADCIAEIRLSKSNGKISHESPAIKADSEKKRKVVHSKPPKSSKKIKANLQTEEEPGSPISLKTDKIAPKKARESFGIGASIMKAANQMNCSTPTGLIACSNPTSKKEAKNNGSGKSLKEKPKAKAKSEREISASATKTPSGKPNSINMQLEEFDKFVKETPSTDLVKDSMSESKDLKEDSSKEQLHEDMKDATSNEVGITMKDANLTEEKITGLDLKEDPSKEQLHEDMKDAANDKGEITMKDSNLAEEKITGLDLKEQPGNKNATNGADSSAE